MNQGKQVYLVRHGETDWTISGQHTGKTDIPLTENGRSQAKKIGKELKSLSFQKAFVSPLIRAKETFELAKLSIKAEIEANLIEWEYGKYEGLTSKEIHNIDPHWSLFTQGAPEGESLADIGARANQILHKVRSLNGSVILFSHGHFLRAFAARWLDLSPSFGRHLALAPGSISILGYEHHSPAILRWNCISHLE